jgi:hypothetical protein
MSFSPPAGSLSFEEFDALLKNHLGNLELFPSRRKRTPGAGASKTVAAGEGAAAESEAVQSEAR